MTRDGSLLLLPLWEHPCCGTVHWSAARRCDRCGAVGAARRISSRATVPTPVVEPATPTPVIDTRAPCVSLGRLRGALIFGSAWMAGMLFLPLGIGAIEALERRHYLSALLLGIGATATPALFIAQVVTKRSVA